MEQERIPCLGYRNSYDYSLIDTSMRQVNDMIKEEIREYGIPEADENDRWSLYLISADPAVTGDIAVTKDSFLIGRKGSVVDGIVGGSPMVGRVHCRIDRNENGYTITDLESRNGTKLNGERIKPDTACRIVNGDVISLAGTKYWVLIKYRF